MQFVYNEFICEVEVFRNEKDIILRFYDSSKDYEEKQIINYVVADSGYGFLCLRYKGDCCLLSGYLDKAVFNDEKMIDAAIEFVEQVSPECNNCYMPYHIDCVEFVDFIEYNGEM